MRLRIRVSLEATLLGPRGEVLLHRQLGTNSWVKQFPQGLYVCFANSTLASVKDTSGNTATLATTESLKMDISADAADATFGLLVGTGTTTPTRDDSALATVIAHGTGSGQLYYQVERILSVTAISGGYRITTMREFNNNSGASITIQEAGLVGQFDTTGAGIALLLLLRDLVSGGLAVGDGQAALLRYNLDFSV